MGGGGGGGAGDGGGAEGDGAGAAAPARRQWRPSPLPLSPDLFDVSELFVIVDKFGIFRRDPPPSRAIV